jgi:quinol monooxygenase YgiN
MYGLIGKFTAQPGSRDRLISLLLDGVQSMPGCHSYVVAKDPKDADVIWITEVWDDESSHRASLELESVQAAIRQAMPLIAGMESVATTEPVGGHGLG